MVTHNAADTFVVLTRISESRFRPLLRSPGVVISVPEIVGDGYDWRGLELSRLLNDNKLYAANVGAGASVPALWN